MSEPIELTRCRLRPWRTGDLTALLRHADDRAVWRNLQDSFPHPYTERDARAWLASAGRGDDDDDDARRWAVEVDGAAAGGIGLHFQGDIYRLTAFVGYWLGRDHWGRGIATEALAAVCAYGFARRPLQRIEARVLAWNPASARVLEKAGFRYEGRQRRAAIKDGHVLDLLLYARLRDYL